MIDLCEIGWKNKTKQKQKQLEIEIVRKYGNYSYKLISPPPQKKKSLILIYIPKSIK